MNEPLYITARLVCDQLTDLELAALHLYATSGFSDPTPVAGYEKWRPLLTQENQTKIHEATAGELSRIVLERLGKRT